MVAVANRIFVNPEYAEQFEERFRNRAHLVDGMPGFISNKVLRPQKKDHPYIVLTFWESHEHFKNLGQFRSLSKRSCQIGIVAQRGVYRFKPIGDSRGFSGL